MTEAAQTEGLEGLIQYIARCPFSLEWIIKLTRHSRFPNFIKAILSRNVDVKRLETDGYRRSFAFSGFGQNFVSHLFTTK